MSTGFFGFGQSQNQETFDLDSVSLSIIFLAKVVFQFSTKIDVPLRIFLKFKEYIYSGYQHGICERVSGGER